MQSKQVTVFVYRGSFDSCSATSATVVTDQATGCSRSLPASQVRRTSRPSISIVHTEVLGRSPVGLGRRVFCLLAIGVVSSSPVSIAPTVQAESFALRVGNFDPEEGEDLFRDHAKREAASLEEWLSRWLNDEDQVHV